MRDRKARIADASLTVAQLGYAHWFFGNLYEAVAKIPERLAGAPDLAVQGEPVSLSSVLRPGSPVRYHLAGAPITVVATVSAVTAGWNRPSDRLWLAMSAACTLSGGLLTGYVVREINLKLFFTARPLAVAEQEELLRRWHRLNRIRLVAAGVAWLAAERVRSSVGCYPPGTARSAVPAYRCTRAQTMVTRASLRACGAPKTCA